MDDVTFPEDLTTLSDDELSTLLADVRSEFERNRDEGSRDLALLTRLVEQVERIEGEQNVRVEAAAEADRLIAELDARLNPVDSDTGTDDDPDADDDPDEDADADADAPEGVLITAAARPAPVAPARVPSRNAVARQSPRPKVPTRQMVSITAAADVPGIATGARMDVTRVAAGFHDRARGLNNGSPRVSVARITKPSLPTFTDDPARNQQILDEVVNSRVNDAAALVASGGWCVPSQPLYDLFEVGDTDGLFDLPSVGSNRGGVLVPSFFVGTDAAAALWTWTEADDISAIDGSPTKPCLKIPCPTWTDVRNAAYGLCVTHGNLSDRAFPELTRSFVNLVMRGHAHRMSQVKLAAVVATATPVTAAGLDSDAAGDLINALQVQATTLRTAYGYSRSRVVEAVLPDWTIAMLRGNVAKRAGVDLLSVSDAQITDWLTAGGIRPQFVSGYQPLAANATDWPTTLNFLVYLSGSYVWSDGGQIDLGVVRDSVLNATNDFTAAWSEEFGALAQPGPDARNVTVTIDTDGVTGCCPAA